MACYQPLQAFESGVNPETGKKVIRFVPKTIQDISLSLPCGKCIGCKIEYTRQWAVRGICELITTKEKNLESSFVTLTYNNAHYPPHGDLVKKDIQDFAKRLKQRHTEIPIRIFYSGEYAPQNLRPHWHLIIFGYDFPDKTLKEYTSAGNLLYTSDELEYGKPEKRIQPLWYQGFHRIGNVTFDSIQYVAKYITKKLDGDLAHEISEGDFLRHYERYDPDTNEIHKVHKEFSETPRRPGLGSEFIKKYYKEVYPSDTLALTGKGIQRTTKYFDKIMQDIDIDLLDITKEKRKKHILSNIEELSPHRQKTKEEIAKRKLQRLDTLRTQLT